MLVFFDHFKLEGIDPGEYHLPVKSTDPNGQVLRKVCLNQWVCYALFFSAVHFLAHVQIVSGNMVSPQHMEFLLRWHEMRADSVDVFSWDLAGL